MAASSSLQTSKERALTAQADAATPAISVEPGGNGTGTLGKAMAVLDIIASASQPLRFTDVLALSDQPRGTLHRQISNLIEEGLVVVNADQTYSTGLRLLKLAAIAWSTNSVRSIASPHLTNLHEITGETVHLGQMDGSSVVYLDKIESRQTVRMHSQKVHS